MLLAVALELRDGAELEPPNEEDPDVEGDIALLFDEVELEGGTELGTETLVLRVPVGRGTAIVTA